MKKMFLIISLIFLILLIFSVSYVNAQQQKVLTLKDLINNFAKVFTGRAIQPTSCTPTITTSSIPTGNTGIYFSITLTASGLDYAYGDPCKPYYWYLASGSLPPGLNLNQYTGVISSIPTTTGTYYFTIGIFDQGIQQGSSKSFSITITSLQICTPGSIKTGTQCLVCYAQGTGYFQDNSKCGTGQACNTQGQCYSLAVCTSPSCNPNNNAQYCSNGQWANCASGQTCSNGQCVISPTCTDSDNGKNYYVKGSIISNADSTGYTGSYIKYDSCDSFGNLFEYYCTNNYGAGESYKCLYGCSNGACLQQPTTQYTLTINKAGTGSGWISSDINEGIDCVSTSSSCTYSFNPGTQVFLNVVHPDTGSTFAGWSGCDSITGGISCSLTLNYNRQVTAAFNKVTQPLTVDLKVNNYDDPPSVEYKSILNASWTSTGAYRCAGYGNFVPLVGGGLWNDLMNLPTSGSKLLYAYHQNPSYIGPLQLGLQCFNKLKLDESASDTVSITFVKNKTGDVEPPKMINSSGDKFSLQAPLIRLYLIGYEVGTCIDNVAMDEPLPYKIDYFTTPSSPYAIDCKSAKINNYTDGSWGKNNNLTILDSPEMPAYCIIFKCRDSSDNIAEFYSSSTFSIFGKVKLADVNADLPPAYVGGPYEFNFLVNNFNLDVSATVRKGRLPKGLELKVLKNYQDPKSKIIKNGVYLSGKPEEAGDFKFSVYLDSTKYHGNFPENFDEKEFNLKVYEPDAPINDGSAYVHTLTNGIFTPPQRYDTVHLIPVYYVPKNLQNNINSQWKEKISATMARVKTFHEAQFRGQSNIELDEPQIIVSEDGYDKFYPDLISKLSSNNDRIVVFGVKGFAPVGFGENTNFFSPITNDGGIWGGVSYISWPKFEFIDINSEGGVDIIVAHEVEHGGGIFDLKDRSLLGSNGAPDLFPLSNGAYINSLDLINMGVRDLYPLKITGVNILDSNNNILTSGVTELRVGEKIEVKGSGFIEGSTINLVYRDVNGRPQRRSMNLISRKDYEIIANVPNNIDSNFAFIEVLLPNGQRHLYDKIVTVQSSGVQISILPSIASEFTFEDTVNPAPIEISQIVSYQYTCPFGCECNEGGEPTSCNSKKITEPLLPTIEVQKTLATINIKEFQDVKLIQVGETYHYKVTAVKEVQFLDLIPVDMKVTYTLDAKTAQIQKVEEPWWSILTTS